jgi:hypothetical protein
LSNSKDKLNSSEKKEIFIMKIILKIRTNVRGGKSPLLKIGGVLWLE